MNKKSCLWMALFALIIICIAGIALVYFQARARAFNSRPLVLIHSPINHEQFAPGEGALVHATARSERGVKRVEFWADGALLAVQEPPESGPLSPLVLSARWQAGPLGSHVLLVRAVSGDGVEGQSTVAVEVVGEEEAALGGHIVQAGETLESIAAQYGVSPADVAALNPDVDPGGITPGDELIVPGGSGAGEGEDGGEPAPVAWDEEGPPNPLAPAPGSGLTILEYFFPDLNELVASADPVPLRVEVLSLETGAEYEGLHCYVGLAGDPPRWVPDADFDQTTDESFAALGGGLWDVAEYLSGEAARIITWPGNQPLSLDATCVGILGGGTDAVELGRLLLEIPPSEWDGVPRWSPEVSNEGSFRLEYRIGSSTEQGHGIPIWLDPTMTPPTNLTLAGWWSAGHSLYWSYEPRPDEEPIDGFRIYLNGTLLWVEPADARTSALPSQWLFPCVEPYTLTVTAFREGYPDGPESMPSTPPVIIEAEPEHCQGVVYVTFLNLITHDLGGDGRYEDRSGDVGPAYGYFYGNDQQVSFDGRPGGRGLSHNTEYVVRDLWHLSGLSQLRVELAEGEHLAVGFHIDNEDTGRCNDSDDPGCDNLVCEGEDWFDVDVDTTSAERTLLSRDGRCEVTYTLALGAGFPAEGYGGEIPLPWLSVEDVTMVEASQLRIRVRNSGRASWPSREVKVAIARPTGEIVHVLSWPDISLAPGETTILQTATMDFGALPVCVILDPDNEVEEEIDRLASRGILSRGASCMQLPDLVITGVEYDPGASRLLVTVQNQGEGLLENRTIALSHSPLGGGPPAAPGEHPFISLGPWETTVLTMTAPESIHSQWSEGYVVTVDPNNLIAESNNDNNSHTVPAGTRLRLVWTDIRAPWQARNRVEYELSAFIVSAGSRRQVANWKITQDIDWDSCGHDVSHGECDKIFERESPYDTNWFNIAGDEALEINVFIGHERPLEDDFGHTFTWLATGETYGVADGWGAGDPDPLRGCTRVHEGPGDHGWVLGSYSEWAPSLGYWHDWNWYVNFNLCRENAGD